MQPYNIIEDLIRGLFGPPSQFEADPCKPLEHFAAALNAVATAERSIAEYGRQVFASEASDDRTPANKAHQRQHRWDEGHARLEAQKAALFATLRIEKAVEELDNFVKLVKRLRAPAIPSRKKLAKKAQAAIAEQKQQAAARESEMKREATAPTPNAGEATESTPSSAPEGKQTSGQPKSRRRKRAAATK